MALDKRKKVEIQSSKNVITSDEIVVGGNLHIGDIYISGDNSEQVEEDILKDFPIPDDISYPQEPFLGLQRFKRTDARIFFGRDWCIKVVAEKLSLSKGAKVLFLYGPSGVGKSSLLEAGLYPRLENKNWNCYYWRFNPKEDFTSKFPSSQVLLNEVNGSSLIVIDQVEEYFIPKANAEENIDFKKLVTYVKDIIQFNQKNIRFIFSFRKEFLPEIESQFIKNEILFTKFFLNPLSQNDIQESFSRLSNLSDAPWQLRFASPDLPKRIALDISLDDQSPIAPILQITMKDLWKLAVEKNESTPEISLEAYRSYKKEGIKLRDFLNRQLKKLDDKKIQNTGLDLDILMFFTTSYRSAATHNKKSFFETYNHLDQASLKQLIEKLKNLYLISEIATDSRTNNNQLRLTHDALAPIVIDKHLQSTKPGQRARRILENKIAEVKLEISNELDKSQSLVQKVDLLKEETNIKNMHLSLLDKKELSIIDAGKKGMRSYSSLEKELINASKSKLFRERVFNWSLYSFIIIFVSGISWFLYHEIQSANKNILTQAEEAIFNQNYDKAVSLYHELNIKRYEDEVFSQLQQITNNYIINYNINAELSNQIVALILENHSSKESYRSLRAHWAFLFSLADNKEQTEKLLGELFNIQNSEPAIKTPDIDELKIFEEHYGENITNYFKDIYLPELVFVEGNSALGISDFWMSKYEITNQQFLAFANTRLLNLTRPSPSIQKDKIGNWRLKNGESLLFPIRGDGFAAKNYSQWMGGNLPSVKEWEYAAKGGKENKGFKYPGGNQLKELAIYSILGEMERSAPNTIGTRKPNSLGIFDLAGNVGEWTLPKRLNNEAIIKGGGYDDFLPPPSNNISYNVFEIDDSSETFKLKDGTDYGIRLCLKAN